MSDVASMNLLLACSRCDGPVNQEDLVEGIAVRVDGQPVCALCIESLAPAVRVQINRVRALKGLAVTTYRLDLPRHPGHAVYTFTSAGLLLLHRRAVIHGTDFFTPALPVGGAPKPGSQIRARHSQPEAAHRHRLVIGLVAGAAILIGGSVMALLQTGPTPAPQLAQSRPVLVTKPQISPSPPAAPPATTAPFAQPRDTGILTLDQTAAPEPTRNFNDYLTKHDSAWLALQAAEADAAPPAITERLLAQTIADREVHLHHAQQRLQENQLDKAALLIDALSLPAERAEFSDLISNEQALRAQLRLRRLALAEASAENPPATPTEAPDRVATPVILPEPSQVPVVPAQPLTSVPPTPRAIDLQLWTGPVGPPPAEFIDPDGKRKIPSPWPFFKSLAAPRFVAAIKAQGSDRKGRYTLRLNFPNALVTGGGVTLCVHPYAPTRKELAITLVELPGVPEKREMLGAGWRVIQIAIPATGAATVTIQISDVQASLSEPFWLGAVASTSGGLPAATELGLQNPGLSGEDPILVYQPILNLLKIVATERRDVRKWDDQKFLAFASGIKILTTDDQHKSLLYDELRPRLGLGKIYSNLLEKVDVTNVAEIDKLFIEGANPGLESQRPLVVLMPQGLESTMNPDEWARRVREINAHLIEGATSKVKGGYIPVWVVGRLDGKPVDLSVWSKLRNQRSLLLIDLTTQPQPLRGDTQQTCAQLSESLRTLTYQLQLVQIQQAGK